MLRSLAVRALILATVLLAAFAPAAHARSLVDPATLVPPQSAEAVCVEQGRLVQCDLLFVQEWANAPAFELPCGLVYDTRYDERYVTRWFEDGLLVRRLVHQRAEGFWSLAPDGSGPLVTFSSMANWGEVYTVPGDPDSGVGHQRGTDYLIKGPDGAVIAQVSGRTNDEEEFTGRMVFDADVVCEALGG